MKNSRNAIQHRQLKLLQYLEHNNSATVTALANFLDVSPITIRRDLEILEERKLITRFFGGARFISGPFGGDEVGYLHSTTQNLDCKRAIAKRAAELLVNGDIVFINSSATALLIYPYITVDVLIVTNNGRSLQADRPANVELMLTGGEVYGNKQALVGQAAVEMLSGITATKCILGASGVSVSGGITSQVIHETTINRTMLRRCSGEKIVVADHTKIGLEHNFFSSSLSDVTRLITDESASRSALESIRQAGIIVDIVSPLDD